MDVCCWEHFNFSSQTESAAAFGCVSPIVAMLAIVTDPMVQSLLSL